MMLVRTLPTRMRTKAVGELDLDQFQPPTFRYAVLHSWVVARVAAMDNLELFELLHTDMPAATVGIDTLASPADTDTPAAPAAAGTPTRTSPPTRPHLPPPNRPPPPRPLPGRLPQRRLP